MRPTVWKDAFEEGNVFALYLTPPAIGYLSQLILALAIAGFLVYRLLSRPRSNRPAQATLLAAFFGAVAVLILLFFLETASLPDQRLYAVYLQNSVVGLVLVLLLQFAYHFPTLPEEWAGEARLTLWLSLWYMVWEMQYAAGRFSELLSRGQVYFRPEWPDQVMVLLFLWAPVVLLRQAAYAPAWATPTPWLRRLWKPQGPAARTARTFALVYLLPVGLSLTNYLVTTRAISSNFRQMTLSVGLLVTLAVFALVYLNSLPETTTFMVKLVGVALATLLAVLGAAGWLITPTYVAGYHPPSPQGQTLRFTPNAGGGYDVADVPYRFDREIGPDLGLVNLESSAVYTTLEYPFSFYGRKYQEVYVADDGAVGLGAPIDPMSIQYHYGTGPAIFALHLNLEVEPGKSGVFAKRDADRLTITWNRMANYNQPETTYTFQLVLHPDGVFEVSYQDMPPELSYQAGAEPRDAVWVIGAVPGNPARPARQFDFAALPVSGGPEGIVHDYYLDFRRHLHTLFAPLTLLIGGSSLLILVGFPLLFYFNLVRPLNALLAGVRRVNAGEMDVEMPVQFQDEIGFLTRAFNGMVAALRSSIANLESQVEQRTRQLGLQNIELSQARSLSEERRALAETASHAKSAFLTSMSHELRTPLNAILGFSQLMAQDDNLTAVQRENLAIISRSGEHLLALLNDVLEISRIEAGRIEMKVEVFDLHLLLQGMSEMFSLRAKQKGLALRLECDPAVPRYVRADQGKLRQVLINLLGNAVKFTSQGSVTLRTSAQARPTESLYIIRFQVADTGIGIAPENLEVIFEPFVQLTGGSQKQEGTGLGLSISRQFVRLMGGELTVQSEGVPGRGSIFSFDLPIEVIGDTSLLEAPPACRAVALEPGQPIFRLLVAEDHAESRKWLVELLAGLGFEVRAVENGQEAIATWQEWQPHLIWMDVRMPVLDGCEATRQIRAMAQGRGPLIVALSASAFEEDRQRLLAAGADDFLRKPVRQEEIVAALTRHLGARFVYQEAEERASLSPVATLGQETGALDLAGLPAAWVDALQEAVTAADAARVTELAAEIRDRRPALAQGLAEALARFDYQAIQEAIHRCSPGPS